MSFPDPMRELTEQHMNDPQPGDRFTEMYCFWLHVVARDGDRVLTREYIGGDMGKQHVAQDYESAEAFRARFAYASIPGYSITYVDNRPEFIEEVKKA